MTMFSNIPVPISGSEWDLDDWVQYVIDNLNYLNSQIGGGGSSFATNEVVIGAVGGGLDGVALAAQELLIGTSGAPIALAAGTGFLRSVNGVVSYGQPDVSITLADIVKIHVTSFVDPSFASGQIVITRAWLQVVFGDITYIACVLSVLPDNSVARGAGQPGFRRCAHARRGGFSACYRWPEGRSASIYRHVYLAA